MKCHRPPNRSGGRIDRDQRAVGLVRDPEGAAAKRERRYFDAQLQPLGHLTRVGSDTRYASLGNTCSPDGSAAYKFSSQRGRISPYSSSSEYSCSLSLFTSIDVSESTERSFIAWPLGLAGK